MTPLSAVPALVVAGAGARRFVDGGYETLTAENALLHLAAEPHLLCHAGMLVRRLALAATRDDAAAARAPHHYDVAELFAFVMPAAMAPPLPSAMGRLLGLRLDDEDPAALRDLAATLLARAATQDMSHPHQAWLLATFLQGARWPWARDLLIALGEGHGFVDEGWQRTGLEVWELLPEWEEVSPQPPPGHQPVPPEEAASFLGRILGSRAEPRPAQVEYAMEVARAFAPRPGERENTVLLAEAGTGLGKTLGYLAPAVLWSRRNAGSVCIATYTKNLQRQLLTETRRIWPDPGRHRRHVAVRKGRENYLCLLNAQEAFASLSAGTRSGAVLAALVARWALASADGDMVGGDFPAWLTGLLADDARRGPLSPMTLGLTDRRGECTYAACPHYRKCFIERNRVRATRADLVIANHAVVLVQAAADVLLGATASEGVVADPAFARLVFDEGHHLFDAADSAYSGHLTALEAADLRRWIRGPEESRRRGRPLRDRLGDLLEGRRETTDLLADIERAASCLPGAGWRRRLVEKRPRGSAEVFLLLVRNHVAARTSSRMSQTMDLEAECHPAAPELLEAAEHLEADLAELQTLLRRLAAGLERRLHEETRDLSAADRHRIEALSRSLHRRGELHLGGWRGMLRRLLAEAGEEDADTRFADWFSIRFSRGQEIDVGLHSHWVDPTLPLAETVLAPADSVVITSATLRDRPPRRPDDWQSAEMRTGVTHLPWAARRVSFPSPFDYETNTRVIVVSDIDRENMDALAAAFRELFLAANGGALGLFTAISRLRAVHRRILPTLAAAGLPLYAQHVDDMDVGTLVDIFRCQENACLLGTDAVRDGVDVPGRSLRLLVMDRVPWPRPTILERARRAAFGETRWTDMQVRLRLRQAFGRLVRRADDRGVFVMLDSRLASRFHTAFPQGVLPRRVGIAEAIYLVADFLKAGDA